MSRETRQHAINELYTRLVEGEKTPHLNVANLMLRAGIAMDEVDVALRNQHQREVEQSEERARNRQRRTR